IATGKINTTNPRTHEEERNKEISKERHDLLKETDHSSSIKSAKSIDRSKMYGCPTVNTMKWS
ncbi:hypothetical protein NPIL_681961, partial [Nephila pilipes]